MPPSIDSPHKILQASLPVALSAILYGFLGYLGTCLVREHLSLTEMQFWRFLIASAWLFMFTAKTCFNKKIIRENRRFLLAMFFLGAIGYAGSSEFYFVACQSIGTGLAMVTFFSYPVIIAIAAWILQGKKLRAASILILVVMMTGLVLLKNSSPDSAGITGILFGLIAATCYASYMMLSKTFTSSAIDSRLLSMVVCLGCATSFLAMSLRAGHFIFPAEGKVWLHILFLGIFATAIPIQLMLTGLRHISSMRASIISVLEPVVTVVVGVLLLHESFSLLQLFGGVLILGSALLIQFQKEL